MDILMQSSKRFLDLRKECDARNLLSVDVWGLLMSGWLLRTLWRIYELS